MSSTYAGNNVFPTAITIPSDGEPATVSSVNTPLEALADRTAYLKGKTDAINRISFREVHPCITLDSSGSAFDFAYARVDGSNTAFWSGQYNLWIKTGKNTAGHVYIGAVGFFTNFNTGASTPPKSSFGCDSTISGPGLLTLPGRVCLFSSDSFASNPKYILSPATGDFAASAWTTKVLDTNTYASFVRVNDCVVTPTQRVIVVGGGDSSGFGQYFIWKSDDFGNSFTRVTVANVLLFGQYLTRVICGKSGRLVAWVDASGVNDGNKLFYSDDNGDTWSSRSAIGFNNIKDGVYLPDLDLWCFASGGNIYTTPDPVLGAFTAQPFGFTPTAMAGFGSALMYALQVDSSRPEASLSLDGAVTTELVVRDPTAGFTIASIGVNPYGQMCLQTATTLFFTGKV